MQKKANNQFELLTQRRFLPYFLVQFLGAFNDNIFRYALIISVSFLAAGLSADESNTLINLSAALFILPFFLFSSTAGQFADKYEKSWLIQRIKLMEIFIMLCAAVGFFLNSIPLLMVVLFLMGTQSAFFGPIKYSILPQHLREEELVGGNGMVEMGTFLAILLGTMLGSNLIQIEGIGVTLVVCAVIGFACLGYLVSRAIPTTPATDETLKINWNIFSETWQNIQFARHDQTVFLSIMGNSWFWFLGSAYLAQLPNYTRLTLGSDEQVFTLLLVCFSVGIALGSALCERLSGRLVEIGLVPFGSIGLTVFGIDLFFAAPGLDGAAQAGELMNLSSFWQSAGSWRVMFDIALIGIFGGFYIVPLYALIQQRSEPSHRARIIAANNILNAVFMSASAVTAILMLNAGLNIPQFFLVLAILNAIVALYIYNLVPEFLMRFIVWLLIHTFYRVRAVGQDNIPDEGPFVLVCNHVSYVDALIIAGCVRRPPRFVMYYKIFQAPVLNFVFRTAKAIPIASQKEDPAVLEEAFERVSKALRRGEIVCIFPEGRLTKDGEMDVFRGGVERILEKDAVPVIPMALRGLWGSYFSHNSKSGKAMQGIPWKLWMQVELHIGTPIPPEHVSADDLHEKVLALRGDWK